MAVSYIGRSDLPRGLRNNNPGNIRSGDAWQGLIGTDAQSFIIFKDMSWGLRALATDLTNKIQEGVDTISKIVSVYAPKSDNNNVPAYIGAVVATTGNGPDEQLGSDQQTLHDLMRGIMDHELGASYADMVSDADIDQGIGMMNAGLLSLLEAGGIAVQTAFDNVTGGGVGAGTGGNSGVYIGLGITALAGLALYFLTKPTKKS